MSPQRRTNKRSVKSSKGRSFTGGDIPPPAKHTYLTASCPRPVVTESCIVRSLANTTISQSNAANSVNSFNFQLANANVGVGFFDQYKIVAIRAVICPQNNAIGLVTNSSTSLLTMYVCIDYDDSNNLISVAAAEAYSNCIALQPGESCERLFKPRIATAAYAGAFTSYANMADVWLDANSNSVQHYGMKTFVPQATAAQTLLQSWSLSFEYFIQFRKSI